LYDETNVVTTTSDSVISGKIQVNALEVKGSDTDFTLTISGGLSADDNITLSGLINAVDGAHDHTDDTFVPQDVTVSAEKVNNLLTYGIINYADGYGDRIISTTQIPSIPNTASGLTPTLYYYQPPTTFGQSLLSDLSLYKANQVSMGAQTNKRNNLSNLSSKVTSWLVNNSGLNWADVWLDTTTVIDAYGHTVSGLAQTIVDYGYATGGEVGFNGPTTGSTVTDLRDYIDDQKDSAEKERTTLSHTIQAYAENISIQAERVTVQPNLVKPKFKVKISWGSPTLVDNESIKKYVVKVFKVSDGDWESAPTHANMIAVDSNVESTLSVVQGYTPEAQMVLTSVATEVTSTKVTNTSYSLSSVTVLQIGDYVCVHGDTSDKNKILAIDGSSGIVTFVKAFSATGPSSLDFYRSAYEDTVDLRSYWFEVERDETYIVYVRPVTIYDIYGPWSTGLSFETNTLTVGGSTLLALMNTRDSLTRQVTEAQQVKLKMEMEETVAELSKQVAAQPDMVAINNLTTAYKNLQTQVSNL
jgi:hypothetical protein